MSSISYQALLFLDFDGVIHSSGARRERLGHQAPLLCETITPFLPHVGIVISSSWRTHSTLFDLQRFFTPAVAQHIFDVTPQLALHPCEIIQGVREKEIELWRTQNACTHLPYLAIDDMRALFTPRFSAGLFTQAHQGFSTSDAQRLAHWLQEHITLSP